MSLLKTFFQKESKIAENSSSSTALSNKMSPGKKEKVPLEKYATTLAKLIYENKITYLFFLPSE